MIRDPVAARGFDEARRMFESMHSMTLGAWLHDLNPIAFDPPALPPIRWYGISYLLSFVIAYVVMRTLAKRGLIRIRADRVADVIIWLIGGVLVGGRLGYVLFYDPSLLGFSGEFPYWGVLAIHRGGMASHGGIIGVCVAAWRISRGWKDERGEVVGRCPVLHVTDVIALCGVFGLALGRLANFVNGELLGRVVAPYGEPGPWWGVKYPQELVERWGDLPDGQIITVANAFSRSAYAAMPLPEAIDSAIWDLQHGSAQAHALLEPLISTRAPSQLLQMLFDGIVTGVVIWIVWAKPRKPGVVSAWFLLVYGALRILSELVRLPDAGLGRVMGLSRGQWLSVGMVVAGLVLLTWTSRRSAERLGGWVARSSDRAKQDAVSSG